MTSWALWPPERPSQNGRTHAWPSTPGRRPNWAQVMRAPRTLVASHFARLFVVRTAVSASRMSCAASIPRGMASLNWSSMPRICWASVAGCWSRVATSPPLRDVTRSFRLFPIAGGLSVLELQHAAAVATVGVGLGGLEGFHVDLVDLDAAGVFDGQIRVRLTELGGLELVGGLPRGDFLVVFLHHPATTE